MPSIFKTHVVDGGGGSGPSSIVQLYINPFIGKFLLSSLLRQKLDKKYVLVVALDQL